MVRQFDPLTYRHPRSLSEGFRCDAHDAVAGWQYRRPIAWQVYRGIVGGLLCTGALCLMLAYFDVLAP